MSADDFLPLFTFVLIQAALPQLLLVKELMTSLADDEESFGECGYYLATLEASTQHIADLATSFEEYQQRGSIGRRETEPVTDRGSREDIDIETPSYGSTPFGVTFASGIRDIR